MTIMIHIWGLGTYHNIGSIKSEQELNELKQRIDNNDFDSSYYDDRCNGDVTEFGITPDMAMLTVYAMKGTKATNEKLFECSLDGLPYSCFEHRFAGFVMKRRTFGITNRLSMPFMSGPSRG